MVPERTPRFTDFMHDVGRLPMATAGASQVRVEGVTLQYRTRDDLVTATHRVSFDVLAGDRFVLLGPSGCGKSTLLKAIGGFIRPQEGRILVRGRPVVRPGPDRIMVFQEFDQLLPWKTVRQNVLFPLLASGRRRGREAERVADRCLERVNLGRFAEAFPHTLSGGMKQRVAIARGLAMEPDVLLMDEPFAALDALTRRRMQDELLRLWAETRFTLVFVTHSIPEAVRVGSRILVLSPHPGRVRAELDGDAADPVGADGLRINERIHRLLFADEPAGAATDE